MIKRQRASSSSLFLMELILAILLFCIAATICVSVFARSSLMHKSATEQNAAINIVSNTAEIIRSETTEKGIIESLDKSYSGLSIKSLNQDLIIPFDDDFIESDDASYKLIITPSLSDGLYSFDIAMIKVYDETTIFSLNVERGVY